MNDDLTPAPDGYPIKLVRDDTPRMINSTGEPGELFYGACQSEEQESHFLRMKLSEEVAEFLLGGGRRELGDVIAVVRGIADHEDWNWNDMLDEQRDHARGAFFERVMMYGRHPEFDK